MPAAFLLYRYSRCLLRFPVLCIGIQRIENVTGQACERLRLQVIDSGSHAKACSDQTDGKVVKKAHCEPSMKIKGEDRFAEEGHVVERVSVILKMFKFTHVVDNDTTVHDVHIYTVAISPDQV